MLEERAILPRTILKYDALSAKSVIVVALRYGEGEYEPPAWATRSGGGSKAQGDASSGSFAVDVRIARFARANWYKELAERMQIAIAQTIAEAAGEGIGLPPAKAWHRLVNSGLPEKPLALRSGLGWMGKNGIVIASSSRGKAEGLPAHCSAVVLGLILCPVDLDPAKPDLARQRCGDCRLCVDACPTGALGREGAAYERERCIQHWTAIEGEMPAEVKAAWGRRLYGCDSCLDACPYFIPDAAASSDIGRLGPVLPAHYFIENDDEIIHRDLSGTALGLNWMSLEAFRRNARFTLKKASTS